MLWCDVIMAELSVVTSLHLAAIDRSCLAIDMLHDLGKNLSQYLFVYMADQGTWKLVLYVYSSFATGVSQLKIWHFWVIGIERNVCRCTLNKYSVITQFAKLAAGGQLRRCARRKYSTFNTLNPELNSICYLLALLGAHHFLHVSRIRVKLLTFRLLMSYIYMYGAPILDVSRSHATTQHSR